MTSVRGFLQMLSNKPEYTDDLPYFDLMIEELDRANSIISEYLNMAKNKKVNLQRHFLDSLIESIYPIIQADARNSDMNTALELTCPPALQLDASEMRQLILNMSRNSLESMSPGGTLTIGTMVEDGEVVLYIKDKGHGVDADILKNLGKPFITTKDNGTGLGIAVCYSIAARHGAKITVDTSPGGTTFFIRFPLPFI